MKDANFKDETVTKIFRELIETTSKKIKTDDPNNKKTLIDDAIKEIKQKYELVYVKKQFLIFPAKTFIVSNKGKRMGESTSTSEYTKSLDDEFYKKLKAISIPIESMI